MWTVANIKHLYIQIESLFMESHNEVSMRPPCKGHFVRVNYCKERPYLGILWSHVYRVRERERDSKLNFIANFFPQKLSYPNWMFGEKNFETGLKIGWNKSSFLFSKMSSDDGATIVSALLYLVWIGHVHRNLINKMCGGRLRCIKLKHFTF